MKTIPSLDTKGLSFHPVIHLPDDYEVYDLTGEYDPLRIPALPYGIGKYNEQRKGVYTQDLFSGVRDIHVGIDIGCPIGTQVHAFFDGEIFLFGNNPAPGDYGYTLITKHTLNSVPVWALHGHLSEASISEKVRGSKIRAGQVIAWVGDRHENGGWNPHLHFQLSLVEPEKADLPGVVSSADREWALKIYPDPQLVLGLKKI
ncbi:MAG: peptidoglycan DD-metalloendopeptidase family protein [Oligoflexia bacterium]|nr:peptidoglycan DD-metalloendopeptidase family protein [Oligoflexia bacterium]